MDAVGGFTELTDALGVSIVGDEAPDAGIAHCLQRQCPQLISATPFVEKLYL